MENLPFTLIDAPYIQHNLLTVLGMKITENTEGYIEGIMTVNHNNCQPFGLLHGGATIALAESLAGVGSSLLCKEHQLALGTHVTATHFSSAKIGQTVVAKATLIYSNNQLHNWQIDVFEQYEQKFISSIQITNTIIKRHA